MTVVANRREETPSSRRSPRFFFLWKRRYAGLDFGVTILADEDTLFCFFENSFPRIAKSFNTQSKIFLFRISVMEIKRSDVCVVSAYNTFTSEKRDQLLFLILSVAYHPVRSAFATTK